MEACVDHCSEPGAERPRVGAAIAARPHALHHEQRVAFGLGEQGLDAILIELRAREMAAQGASRLSGEPLEPQLGQPLEQRERVAQDGQRVTGVELFAASSEHDEHPATHALADQVVDELLADLIAPLRIISHQQRGLRRAGDCGHRGIEDPSPALGVVQPVNCHGRAELGQQARQVDSLIVRQPPQTDLDIW